MVISTACRTRRAAASSTFYVFFADEICIFEAGVLLASHVPLEGRDQKRLDPAHRKPLPPPLRRPAEGEPIIIRRAGDHVARRSLEFYEAVGRRLAGQGRTR